MARNRLVPSKPLFLLASLLALVAKGGTVNAEDNLGNQIDVASARSAYGDLTSLPSDGRFRHLISIEAPPFRGIEPKLSLRYDSRQGNGFLGIGWRLSGISEIERMSPGRGAPNYNVSDIYMLDGQELVRCEDTSRDESGLYLSPSCRTGGTHTTKAESYLRIHYATTLTWTVTKPDGTVMTYCPVGDAGQPAWRWSVHTVRDTSANVVKYFWTCEFGQDCYPTSVRYNGVSIDFVREPRFDHVRAAIGNRVRDMAYRLRAIDICVGIPGSEQACSAVGEEDPRRARRYELRYRQPGTAASQSLLETVQVFGKDAVVAATNYVRGSSLPATRFTYAPDTDQFEPRLSSSHYYTIERATIAWRPLVLDVDGDGAANACFTTYGGLYWHVLCRVGDENVSTQMTADGWGGSFPLTGDYNGDGKDDLCLSIHGSGGWNFICTYSESGGFTIQPARHPITSGMSSTGWRHLVVDYNADGIDDLCVVYADDTHGWFTHCLPGQSNDTFGPLVSQTLAWGMRGNYWSGRVQIVSAEINGDGKVDLCTVIAESNTSSTAGTNYGGWETHCRLGVGDGTFGPAIQTSVFVPANNRLELPTGSGEHTWPVIPVDLNGDGKSDLCASYTGRGLGWTTHCALGRGNGTFLPPVRVQHTRATFASDDPEPAQGYPGYQWTLLPGDYNGDGCTDLCISFACSSESSCGFKGWRTFCAYSRGDNSFEPSVTQLHGDAASGLWWSPYSFHYSADFNGDGKSDLYHVYTGDWNCGGPQTAPCVGGEMHTALSRPDHRNRLVRVANGIGGLTTVEYQHAWVRPIHLETVSKVTHFYMRGQTSTTRVVSQFGYYDWKERRFQGFSSITTQLPCPNGLSTDCGFVVTEYRNDGPLAGLPERVKIFRRPAPGFDAGILLDQSHSYVTNFDPVSRTWPLPMTFHRVATVEKVYSGQFAPETPWRRVDATYHYDDLGFVWGTGDATQAVWRAGYGNLTRVCDQGNESEDDTLCTTIAYHPNDSAYIVNRPANIQMTTSWGQVLRDTYLHYDAAGLGDDPTTWQVPPTHGRATRRRSWLAPPGRFVVTRMEYDTWGNLAAIVGPPTPAAPSGARSDYGYDDTYHMFLTEVRDPLYSADARHRQRASQVDPRCWTATTITDENGLKIKQGLDALCRAVSTTLVTAGVNVVTRQLIFSGFDIPACAADPACRFIEERTPGAAQHGELWTRTRFDGFGRPYSVESRGPAPGRDIIVDYEVDGRGGVGRFSNAHYADEVPVWTELRYDALGRPVKLVHADLHSRRIVYGLSTISEIPWGSVLSIDELGHEQEEVIDSRGNLRFHREKLLADSSARWLTTTYAYDLLGQLELVMDPLGNVTRAFHDSLGRTHAIQDPDHGRWYFTHDDAGRLIRQTDAQRQVTEYSYDALGRLRTRVTRAGTPKAETCEWRYDEVESGAPVVGFLTSDKCGSDRVARRYSYTSLGQLEEAVWTVASTPYVFGWKYDGSGNFLLGRGYPDGTSLGDHPGTPAAETPIGYDSAGRLTSIPEILKNVSYTAAGDPKVRIAADDTQTVYYYDADRQWLERILTRRGRLLVQDVTYRRDAEGKVAEVVTPSGDESWTYKYDDLERLIGAFNHKSSSENQIFSYDAIGNMTRASTLGAYRYPNSGRTSTQPHAVSSAGPHSFRYDGNGAPTNWKGQTLTHDGGGSLESIGNARMWYGPDGVRLRKESTSGKTLYLGNDYEVNQVTGVATKYVELLGRLIGKRVASETYWIHTDQIGSVVDVTNAAGVVLHRSYTPYGDIQSERGAHVEAFGFTGERRDDNGLIYLNARYYDPSIGRMLSADPEVPTSRAIGLNSYAYAFNDPVNWADPSGFEPVRPYVDPDAGNELDDPPLETIPRLVEPDPPSDSQELGPVDREAMDRVVGWAREMDLIGPEDTVTYHWGAGAESKVGLGVGEVQIRSSYQTTEGDSEGVVRLEVKAKAAGWSAAVRDERGADSGQQSVQVAVDLDVLPDISVGLAGKAQMRSIQRISKNRRYSWLRKVGTIGMDIIMNAQARSNLKVGGMALEVRKGWDTTVVRAVYSAGNGAYGRAGITITRPWRDPYASDAPSYYIGSQRP